MNNMKMTFEDVQVRLQNKISAGWQLPKIFAIDDLEETIFSLTQKHIPFDEALELSVVKKLLEFAEKKSEEIHQITPEFEDLSEEDKSFLEDANKGVNELRRKLKIAREHFNRDVFNQDLPPEKNSEEEPISTKPNYR